MNEDLHLTPISLLPPITPEDHAFVLQVMNEYNLQLDELCWLIRDVRNSIQDGFSDLQEASNEDFEKFDRLFPSDVEIKGINISTNKGTVEFKPSDPLFYYFKSPIDRIKWKVKRQKNNDINFISKITNESAFLKIAIYFLQNTDLTKDQKYVAIGMFLAHVKICKGKPILNKDEYDISSHLISWKNYLSGRVKPLLIKFKSEFLF